MNQLGVELSEESLSALLESMSSGPFDRNSYLIDYRDFLQFMEENPSAPIAKPTSEAPDLIQKLLWHSRQMDVTDENAATPTTPKFRPGSAMSDTYRKFNKSVHRPQPTRSLVDVTTFFDSECYKKPSSTARVRKSTKPGSLALLFDFYAKITSAKKKLCANKLSFVEIQRGSSTITMAEMFILLRDFDVVPRVLTKQELHQVWQTRLRDEDNVYYRELTYTEFVDCLGRCALLAFPKLGHTPGRYSNEFKVNAFIKYLGLDSVKFVRKKLRTSGRDTAGQLNFGVCSDTNQRVISDRDLGRVGKARATKGHIAPYDPGLNKLFEPYHTLPIESDWQCYKAPFVDMGTVLRNKIYRFKVELCNRSSYILNVTSCLKDCYGVRIAAKTRGPLAPGLSHIIDLEANFTKYRPAVAEKHATLLIEINSLRNRQIAKEFIRIPLYINLVNPGSFSATNEGATLKPHKEANLRPASAPCTFSKTSKPILTRRDAQTKRRPYTATHIDNFMDQRFINR